MSEIQNVVHEDSSHTSPTVTLGTVLEAIKKYPERFGIRLREEMEQ